MSVARLIAGIGLNTTEFKKGIGEVSGSTKGLSKNFKALGGIIAGAFSIGAVVSFTKNLANLTSELNGAAKESNATFTGYQALRNTMNDNCLSADKLSNALNRINASSTQAQSGNVRLIGAFNELGISIEDLSYKKSDEIFGMIADAVSKSTDSVKTNQAAFDIFGNRLAGVLMPTLKQVGDEGFGSLTRRMEESSRVLSQEFADIVSDASTILDSWKQKFQVFVSKLILGLDLAKDVIAGFFKGLKNSEALSGAKEAFEKWTDEQAQKSIDAWEKANQERIDSENRRRDAVLKSMAVEISHVDVFSEMQKKAAKERADAAIAEEKRRAEYIRKSWEDLQKEKESYFDAERKAAWNAMSDEEQLQRLMQTRIAYISAIKILERDGQVHSAEYYRMKKDLLALTLDIEKRERNLAQTRKDAGADAIRITNEQVDALKNMRQFLKGMTDDELDDFLSILRELDAGIEGLDFSELRGLEALKGFHIPNESVMNARQFGRALAEMGEEIRGLQLPDLQGLEVLKGFKIPNETSANARQFANAIKTLVDSIKNQDLDLEPIEKLADLFSAINVGAIELVVRAPLKEELTLSMPDGLDSTLLDISGHLKTLAGLKGIIYQ